MVDIGATVLEASRTMVSNGSGSVVATREGNVVGLFTERDLLNRVIGQNLNPGEVLVQDAMSCNLIKICHDASCQQSLQVMRENKIRHLMVFNGTQFLGILSMRNLMDLQNSKTSIQEIVIKAVGGAILLTVVGILGLLVYLIPEMARIADRFIQ